MGNVIDLRPRPRVVERRVVVLPAPCVEPPVGEDLSVCPGCGGVWWRAVVCLLSGEGLRISGLMPEMVCDDCGHRMLFLGDSDG